MNVRIAMAVALVSVGSLSGCARYGGDTEDVVFSGAGGVELHGTLVRPKGAGPFPAVVLLHGAEPATRSMVYRLHANVFVKKGFAALLYDKRGAGRSGGDHEERTYGQLIEDAVAAVGFLRGRKEVDGTRIGLMGASESGWLTPEIAERSGGLAFVVNKVGPALSRRATSKWEAYHELRAEGVSEASAREQVEVLERLWEYYAAPTDDERNALDEMLAFRADGDDSGLPASVPDLEPHVLERLRYDPTPYLERTVTPMLYVYGSEDVNVPTAACVERLKDLASRGRPVSFHVYEGEGHELGGVGLIPPGYSFVEGYAELIGDFAVQQAGTRRERAAS